MDRTKVETTFADLRDGDHLIDKGGAPWHVSDVHFVAAHSMVDFWLSDVRTPTVRLHNLAKPADDPVTVLRIPTHADDVAVLEANHPGLKVPDVDLAGIDTNLAAQGAAANVEAGLGGTVVAEVTAAEVDAARQATDDAPLTLPLFDSLTPLEQRSHLYLLHGVFAEDVQTSRQLGDVHLAAHRDFAAGKLRTGGNAPHTHSPEVTA